MSQTFWSRSAIVAAALRAPRKSSKPFSRQRIKGWVWDSRFAARLLKRTVVGCQPQQAKTGRHSLSLCRSARVILNELTTRVHQQHAALPDQHIPDAHRWNISAVLSCEKGVFTSGHFRSSALTAGTGSHQCAAPQRHARPLL
jgi:hypothetical protein